MKYSEFRAVCEQAGAYDIVRSSIRKAASFVDESTGLTIEPRPVDKSTRIQQMLQRTDTDVSRWMHQAEMKKDAAFDPAPLKQLLADNYGSIGGGALGLLAGAMLGARLGGKKRRGLGALLGGAVGALGMGYAGNALQQSGQLERGYNAAKEAVTSGYGKFKDAWNKGTHAVADGVENTGEALQKLPGKVGLS